MISKIVNWYRNNWYYVGGIIFVGLAIMMSLLVSTSTLFGAREMYDRYPMNKNLSSR